MESFWPIVQIAPLHWKKWKTRIELSNAIFEYIEEFYNCRRWHFSPDCATLMTLAEIPQLCSPKFPSLGRSVA